MSNSIKIKDQKIPYPTEGIVRTSSVDDTVAPDGSVQSAVNVNFDQIGAIKTRLGLTEYADDITGEAVSFGTFNGTVEQAGFARVDKAGATTIVTPEETRSNQCKSVRLNENYVMLFYRGDNNDGYVRVIEVEPDTGVVTTLDEPFEFDTSDLEEIDAVHHNSFGSFEHVLVTWGGGTGNGQVVAQIFRFSVTGGSVQKVGSPHIIYNADKGGYLSLKKYDASNYVFVYSRLDSTDNNNLTILQVDGSYAVSQPGNTLTETNNNEMYFFNNLEVLGDGTNKFINFTTNNNSTTTSAYEINTSNWNISQVGNRLIQTGSFSDFSSSSLFDGENVIFFNRYLDSGVQIYNVNPSNSNVTTLSTRTIFDEIPTTDFSCVSMGDGKSFVNFWSRRTQGRIPSSGYVQLFNVNLSTYKVELVLTPQNFAVSDANHCAALLNDNTIIDFFRTEVGANEEFGAVSLFKTQGSLLKTNTLYVQQENGDVLTTEGTSWTTRRTGLFTAGKARFMQFLNYVWMVNGNSSIGDDVKTSNGGAFGTDLVPDNFPKGDFIQGGFEGRVWVADSLNDVIYFTDIVQFTPPYTYRLTYDPDVNFIKNFSPQDGQTITGFITTPRALLLFKQNSIYRIYGSFNVDAYPAYNVGTYSEESIVQTKKGLFFHHSSGFYKFNYGGEPVEISRTINDFVKAIPRAYYEKVAGVFDGSDAILWSVGPLTVEGVSYSNAVMRYTISTQVWTVYNYEGNNIKALVKYDDGTNLNIIMGTNEGKINKMDSGFNDLGELFSFEMIDRWRSYSPMYADEEKMVGFNVYNENAAGTLLQYQNKKQNSNKWSTIGSVTEKSNCLFSGFDTEIDNVSRLRLAGTTKGDPIVIHGIEVLRVDIEGYNLN